MNTPKLLIASGIWLASVATAYFVGSRFNSPERAADAAQQFRTAAPHWNAQGDALQSDGSSLGGIEADTDQVKADADPADTDIRELISEAFALPTNDQQRNRKLERLLAELAETSPLEALELASQIESLRASEDARTEILEVWGRSDPMAALAWAEKALANEPMRRRSSHIIAIYQGFAANNPEAAFTSALELPTGTSAERRLQTRALEEIVEAQIDEGGLRQAQLAIDLLEDGPTKNRLLSEMIGEWAEYDPLGAAAYVDGLTGEISPQLKTSLLGEWAESDPAAAAAWLSDQEPNDAVLGRASAEIIREWTRYDMTASAEWLNSLPESPALDRAVMSYTYRAAQEDPANAMTWAESINNNWMRNRMMDRVASSWRVDDPDAFQAYLENSSLSDEQKQRLSNAKDFHGGGRWR